MISVTIILLLIFHLTILMASFSDVSREFRKEPLLAVVSHELRGGLFLLFSTQFLSRSLTKISC